MNTEPPYAGLKWAHYLRVMLTVPLDQGTQGNKGRKGISLKRHTKSCMHSLTSLTIEILSKLEMLMDAFIKSEYNYCSLVWMFDERTIKFKVSKLCKRALRIVCKGCKKDLENSVNNSVTNHQRSVQLRMVEIFKTNNLWNPTF